MGPPEPVREVDVCAEPLDEVLVHPNTVPVVPSLRQEDVWSILHLQSCTTGGPEEPGRWTGTGGQGWSVWSRTR